MEKTSTTAAGFTDEKNSTREGSPANIDKHPALKLAKKDYIVKEQNSKVNIAET